MPLDTANPRSSSGRPETAIYDYVYCARFGDRAKIGIATDPGRRLQQIRTATGLPIKEWQAWYVYAPGPCERHLHQMFRWLRSGGEWFDCGQLLFQMVATYMNPRQAKLSTPQT